jgi:hypothetical protein
MHQTQLRAMWTRHPLPMPTPQQAAPPSTPAKQPPRTLEPKKTNPTRPSQYNLKNITQPHTPDTIPEHTQLEDTAMQDTPSPPRPSNESPPTPRAPSNRRSRPKNALLETEMSPPPPPKRQRLRPEPPTKRQPKRTRPDSEMSPPPPAKKSPKQNSHAPSLGRNKKGSERVAKQGPRKKKTPHI